MENHTGILETRQHECRALGGGEAASRPRRGTRRDGVLGSNDASSGARGFARARDIRRLDEAVSRERVGTTRGASRWTRAVPSWRAPRASSSSRPSSVPLAPARPRASRRSSRRRLRLGPFPFAPAALADAVMYQYSETLEFDLAVVLFVVAVMPLSVFLMQSKRRVARLAAFALMFLAVVYVGGFEHYRLHRPEVTEGGLKRALVPTVVLELIESEFQLRYLPIAAEPADVAAARAAIAPPNSDADPSRAASVSPSGRKLAPGARRFASHREKAQTRSFSSSSSSSLDPAGEPLMVHLSHRGAGDAFFRDVLHDLETRTCASHSAVDAIDALAPAPATEPPGSGCARWCSGDADDFRQNVHSFSFESPHPRAMHLLGRPYRAVFVVRDPRDLIAEAYLEHLNTTEAWARLPRADLGGDSFQTRLRAMSVEEGVDLEIDRFTAAMGLQLGIQRVFGGGGVVGDLSLDTRVSEFVRSLRAFAVAADPDVRFVRYEDALVADRAGFELMGVWFGLDGEPLRQFADACEGARARATETDASDPGADADRATECDPDGCEERGARSRTTLAPGAWREHFTAENAARFERSHGTLLRGMGYLAAKDARDVAAAR